MAELWGAAAEVQHLAAAVGRAGRGRGRAGPADHRGSRSTSSQAHVDDIDFAKAADYERKLRHDVMAHVHTYGDACPDGPGDHPPGRHQLLRHRQHRPDPDARSRSSWSRGRLVAVIDRAGEFAEQHRDLACLGFTHLQPAQPTTVGKRAMLVGLRPGARPGRDRAPPRTAARPAASKEPPARRPASWNCSTAITPRSASSTSSSPQKMGFDASYAVTGQTYSRKVDAQVLDVLAGIAGSAHKAATDLRLLQSRKEIEEPFEKRADRLVGHGLQAQPDAGRADLRAGPVRDAACNRAPRPRWPRSGWSARSTTAPTAGWCCRRRSWPSTRS